MQVVASSLLIRSLDNQLASSLLTTCNRFVIIKLEQAIRTHPDIGLMTARQQSCSRLAATCVFLAVLVSMLPQRCFPFFLSNAFHPYRLMSSSSFFLFIYRYSLSFLHLLCNVLYLISFSRPSMYLVRFVSHLFMTCSFLLA